MAESRHEPFLPGALLPQSLHLVFHSFRHGIERVAQVFQFVPASDLYPCRKLPAGQRPARRFQLTQRLGQQPRHDQGRRTHQQQYAAHAEQVLPDQTGRVLQTGSRRHRR